MDKICKKQIVMLLFFLSTGLNGGMAMPESDENLDHNLPEIMIEEELRLLEKDLNGDPYKGESILRQWDFEKKKYVPYVPESDIIAIQALARYRLNAIPRSEYYGKNIALMRTEENRAIGQRVGEMTRHYATKYTSNQRIIANAEKIESQNVMDLLKAYPLRQGSKIYHCFGNPLKNRVRENIMKSNYGN